MIQNLKLLREKHGISQQRLASAIGVSQQSVNKYENHNVEPDIATLVKIADYFHTSVDYLIGHSELVDEPQFILNVDEIKIVSSYRQLSLGQKESIHLVIDNFLK